jgi:allantoinase
MAHAYISKRIVTPQGTRPGVLLVEDEKIRDLQSLGDSADALHDCGDRRPRDW